MLSFPASGTLGRCPKEPSAPHAGRAALQAAPPAKASRTKAQLCTLDRRYEFTKSCSQIFITF